MTTLNERIKKVRKALDLTQQEFADRLGTARNNIAGYETSKRSPSEAVISLICKTFNVNEIWLRTGDGEMFVKRSRDDELAAFVNELLASESADFRRRLVTALSRLKPEQWDALEAVTLELLKEYTVAGQEPDTPPSALESEADQFAAMAREQYLSEKLRESEAFSAKESDAG